MSIVGAITPRAVFRESTVLNRCCTYADRLPSLALGSLSLRMRVDRRPGWTRARPLLLAAGAVTASGGCARQTPHTSAPGTAAATFVEVLQPAAAPYTVVLSTAVVPPPSATSPQLPGPEPVFNSGPTVFVVTLYGMAAVADSVVLLSEAADCRADGLFFGGEVAPVTAAGAFALTVVTQRPRPCVRVAAVRAGRRGPVIAAHVGPLASRNHGAPRVPPDSARIALAAPQR